MPESQLDAYLSGVEARSETLVTNAGSLPIAHPGVRVLMESAGAVPRLHGALVAALELASEWMLKSQALDAAAGQAAAEDPNAPGIGMKHARSIAYDECATVLGRVIEKALLGAESTEAGGRAANP